MTIAADHPVAPARVSGASNTPLAYGWVERALHWAIAALILTAIPLGVIAYDGAEAIEAGTASPGLIERTVTLFSIHKTVGVTVFALAVIRVAWALAQPRPKPIQRGREAQLAAVVHWLLYGSLILVPLLGWTQHAASTGYAPILWPLGQSLPLIPKDPVLSETLGILHTTAAKVLVVALALHVAGALKHALWDRDGTLARMATGRVPDRVEAPHGRAAPASAALAVWAAALGLGFWLAEPPAPAAAGSTAQVERAASALPGWMVEEGTLSITVTQMGAPVTGTFADWDAAISFDPDTGTGAVEVAVATGSLTLGSVTSQATGDEFLSTGAFPEARFDADIAPEGEAYVADGTFSLRGVEIPLRLPFALVVADGVATMEGAVEVDRRDFSMGESYPDETNVGFGVTIDVALTARRE